MKEIAFFDIDNTLLSHSTHCVPQSTINALKKLKSLGKKCFIATSRSYVEITNLPKEVMELMDGFICEGGAKVIYHDEVIIRHVMDEPSKNRLIQLIRDHHLAYRYCGLDIHINYLDHEDEFASKRFYELYEMVPEVIPYTTQPLTHILFYCFDDMLAHQIINEIPRLEVIRIGEVFDVTDKDVTKGSALKQICHHFNVPLANTVCFGDSANDIEMIKAAGLGIAMGNGNKSVQRFANYVTSDIDDNGIYNACVYFNWFR